MGVAKFCAFVQVAVCGLLSLAGVLGLASASYTPRPAVAVTVTAGLLSAVAVAFLCRSDAARLFLAGLHILACAAVIVIIVAVHPVFAVILPFCGAGAFAFVARDVRAWCAA